jgi:hypothetical protein
MTQEIDEQALEQDANPAPVKKGGWPKGKPRTARTPTAAAARTEPVRTGPRQRTRKGGTLVDKYDLPDSMKADFKERGMDAEWKRETVYGATDPAYDVFMREQGFEPVDSSRYPEFVTAGQTGPIRRDGMILMERPIELTKEAKAEERAAANEAVRVKEEQLGTAGRGEFQRQRADGSSTVAINKTVERGGMEIE